MVDERDLTDKMKPEAYALIGDPDKWSLGVVPDRCAVCGQLVGDDEIPFLLYKDAGDDISCMAFHFKCAVLDEYVSEFEEESASAWVFDE